MENPLSMEVLIGTSPSLYPHWFWGVNYHHFRNMSRLSSTKSLILQSPSFFLEVAFNLLFKKNHHLQRNPSNKPALNHHDPMVSGWWFETLWKILVNWYRKMKNVPNHQPGFLNFSQPLRIQWSNDPIETYRDLGRAAPAVDPPAAARRSRLLARSPASSGIWDVMGKTWYVYTYIYIRI